MREAISLVNLIQLPARLVLEIPEGGLQLLEQVLIVLLDLVLAVFRILQFDAIGGLGTVRECRP